jgi:S1-C subfamily serine protease
MEQLRDAVDQAEPGKEVTIEILRAGKTQNVKVTLGAANENENENEDEGENEE